ncbi:MAG: hypothetical protein EA385_06050 [Salinarimonadaceae bacterium]|nr:MAG: hypothetical protein EA385_06050 [Salinarimonadaceae bacterium]
MFRYVKYENGQRRVVTVPRWAIALGVVAAMLVGFLMLILAAGVALVAIPAVAIAALVAAWFGRGRRAPVQAPSDPDIIDAEYRIVERHERDTDR